MQAIQTKYICPTNVKGSRISATCASKRIILEWDDSINSEENHKYAAMQIIRRMGWNNNVIGGQLKDQSYVWVMIPKFGFEGDNNQ